MVISNESNSNETCPEWWCDENNTLIILESLVIMMCVIGSFGNIVTVFAISFSSLRNNVNCILIGSLSVASFLYCAMILPMQAVIFHKHRNMIGDPFCPIAGCIRYTLVGVIMMHLSVIALYRFLNVVHLSLYKKLALQSPLASAIVACWIFPLVFTVPAGFQIWGSFSFQSDVLACTFTTDGVNHSNRIVTVTLGFIVPCVFIVVCYARIGFIAYGSSKRISQWKGNTVQLKALRLSGMMLCIFLVFFLGTFPYFIVNVTDKNYKRPIHHIWTTMLGWLLYCLNPIVYTVMDNNFRTAYRRFLLGDCEKNPMRRGTLMRASTRTTSARL